MPGPEMFRSRKEENIRLHDEADLVNFRSDALKRFLSNQEYMENVALKPIHTSRIVPPRSFPEPVENRYPEDADEEALRKVLREAKIDELFCGDLRLMQAKEKLVQEELQEAQLELDRLSPTEVFGDEAAFQNAAIEKLAKSHGTGFDLASAADLEALVSRLETDYKAKFHKNYVLDHKRYDIKKIPLEQLAPDIKAESAPELYNPRLIASYVGVDNQAQSRGGNPHAAGTPNANTFPHSHVDRARNPPMGAYSEANRYINEDHGFDDFDMMMHQGEGKAEPASEPAYGEKSDSGPYASQPDKSRPVPERQLEEDVNMDEINKFLADPDEAGAMDEGNMDDMDALMNFDEASEHPGAVIDDDAFNVDFLSQMDNEME